MFCFEQFSRRLDDRLTQLHIPIGGEVRSWLLIELMTQEPEETVPNGKNWATLAQFDAYHCRSSDDSTYAPCATIGNGVRNCREADVKSETQVLTAGAARKSGYFAKMALCHPLTEQLSKTTFDFNVSQDYRYH
ncbi:MAG: hypothetical protein OXC63_07420 [Aestuariivita sp.]|nr:hypothetical protein [Aestuariivita sp.]